MLEVDPNAVLESLGPARRFADPSGPAKARLMAAGGALPLPPPQMASVLFALTLDPEAEIAQKAAASLAKLPDNVVDQVLAADVHECVLHWFAEHADGSEARLEKIALNAATSDATTACWRPRRVGGSSTSCPATRFGCCAVPSWSTRWARTP